MPQFTQTHTKGWRTKFTSSVQYLLVLLVLTVVSIATTSCEVESSSFLEEIENESQKITQIKEGVSTQFAIYSNIVAPNLNTGIELNKLDGKISEILQENGISTHENLAKNIRLASNFQAQNSTIIGDLLDVSSSPEDAMAALKKSMQDIENQSFSKEISESDLKQYFVLFSTYKFIEAQFDPKVNLHLTYEKNGGNWRCVAGTFGAAITAGVAGCEVGVVVGGAAGTVTGPGAFATAAGGCVLGGMVGFIGGALFGAAVSC